MDFLQNINTPGAILVVLVGFGLLIFVHELGHFLVARAVGIKCTQFAIGFGPAFAAFRKGIGLRAGTTEPEYNKRLSEHLLEEKAISEEQAESMARGEAAQGLSQERIEQAAKTLGLGDTEYRFNWLIVLGGYVKMLGQEDLDPTARSENPRAYNQKPIWARACVISAGVVMNVIFGLLLFIGAFMVGVDFPSNVVGDVRDDMPAARVYAQGHEGEPSYRGLQAGDRVTHVDGDPVRDLMEIRLATALGHPDTPLELTVERPDYENTLRYVMHRKRDPVEGLLSIGMAPGYTRNVAWVAVGGPEHTAGLNPREYERIQVRAVNGQPVEHYYEYARKLAAAAGEPVEVTFALYEDAERAATRELTLEQRARPRLWSEPLDEGRALHEQPPTNLAGLAPAVLVPSEPDEQTHAYEAGIRAGDVIARADDVRWPNRRQLTRAIRAAHEAGRAVQIDVWRDDAVHALGEVGTDRQGRIGIPLDAYLSASIVGGHVAGSAAEGLEMPAGARVVAVGGIEVQDWAGMQRALGELDPAVEDGQVAVELAYRAPDGQTVEQATLRLAPERFAELQHLGWRHPWSVNFHPLASTLKADNPWQATVLGVEKTHQFITQVYLTILRLVQGYVQIEHLRGPVGIVDEGQRILREGLPYLLFFLGLISVNLAVINFLPIPIVDGGHMVFLAIEKITGSPPGPRVQNMAALIGLALILTLFVTVTYYDIMRLFG